MALAYLHDQNVIHGDVKGGNVLVSAQNKILLCDFGLAKTTGIVTSSSLAGKGSLRWQAPELMGEDPTKTCESDVYAFAMTIYEVRAYGSAMLHSSYVSLTDSQREVTI